MIRLNIQKFVRSWKAELGCYGSKFDPWLSRVSTKIVIDHALKGNLHLQFPKWEGRPQSTAESSIQLVAGQLSFKPRQRWQKHLLLWRPFEYFHPETHKTKVAVLVPITNIACFLEILWNSDVFSRPVHDSEEVPSMPLTSRFPDLPRLLMEKKCHRRLIQKWRSLTCHTLGSYMKLQL